MSRETFRIYVAAREMPHIYGSYDDCLWVAQQLKHNFPDKIVSIVSSRGHHYSVTLKDKK